MNPSESLPPVTSVVPEPASAPAPVGVKFTDPKSPLAPYFLRAGTMVAVALLVLIFLVLNHFTLWHTDVWAHLKFGQWIVEHRQLPDHEPFNPFAAPTRYINFQWLTQAGLYLIFYAGERLAGGDEMRQLAGGVEFLRMAFVLISLTRYIVLLLAYRRVSGSLPLACAALVIVAPFLPFASVVQRPQTLGELLFACLLLALSRPVLSRRALVLVPPCLVLWANIHGSFLVGLALLGVFFLGRLIEGGLSEPSDPQAARSWDLRRAAADPQLRRLLLVLVLSVAGIALLNPHGPRLYLYTLQLARHPNIPTLEEWQPLDFTLGPGGHRTYVVLLVLLTLSQVFSPRALTCTPILLIASFGVFPLIQQRMMAWWVVLAPWLMLPLWAALGARLRWPWLHHRSTPSLLWTLLAVMLVLFALPWSMPAQWLRAHGPRPLRDTMSPGTPWQLAAQLKDTPGAPLSAESSSSERAWLPPLAAALKQCHYPDGRYIGRIFASETQGDYLLWALAEKYPVLAYTHVHLFSPEHWQMCLSVKAGEADWWEVLDRYGVNLVVVEPALNPGLAEALKNDAKKKDPAWLIVVDESDSRSKRDPRTRLLIALRKHPRRVPE